MDDKLGWSLSHADGQSVVFFSSEHSAEILQSLQTCCSDCVQHRHSIPVGDDNGDCFVDNDGAVVDVVAAATVGGGSSAATAAVAVASAIVVVVGCSCCSSCCYCFVVIADLLRFSVTIQTVSLGLTLGQSQTKGSGRILLFEI